MDDDDDMVMIIVGDLDANCNNQDVKPKLPLPIPIKEEPTTIQLEEWEPDYILATAALHGQYLTLENDNQIKEEEYCEYDYLEDSNKEIGNESSSEEEESSTEPRQSYIKQLRKYFPKMRKDDEYIVAHLTELMKQSTNQPPTPPNDFYTTVGNMLVCTYCGLENPTLPIASRHYQKKHGTQYLTCYACGASYKCTTGLYKHEKRCRAAGADLVLRARGRYLGRKGRTRPFLTKNKFLPRGEKQANEPKKRLFCSECTASFRNRDALRSHEYMHRGERPFQCDQCPVAYTSHIALRRHLQIHSKLEYICDVCGKCFKVKTTLIVHMNTHLPQRRFGCDRCPRRFAQKHALQHHINRDHLNIPPPLVCAACPKRFPRVSNLNAHMKAKHGLTVMTRKMFFKALPSMKETELKQATVVFSQNDDNIFAVSKNNVDPDDKKANKRNNKEKKPVKESSEINFAEIFDASDGDVKEVVVKTTSKRTKEAVKTSLNSCEIEFANFNTDRDSSEYYKQSRIPRVDLSIIKGVKKSIQKIDLLPRKNTPREKKTNVAEMHEKIKETIGRNVPDLKADSKEKTKEVKHEPLGRDKANVVKDSKSKNSTVIMTRGKAASQVNLTSKKKK